MSVSIGPIGGGTVRYKGLFDWDDIYYHMADWFKRYRFHLIERMYKHKVPSPLGAEQELHWYGTVNVNDFTKFRIDVRWHLWDLTEIEVVKNGKKKVLTNARIEVKIDGDVIFDYQNKFERNRFTRALRTLWLEYIYRRETTSLWGDMMQYRLWNLQSYLKKLLDMQTQWHEYAGYLGEER